MEDLEAETGKLKTRLSGIEEELGSIVSGRQRIVEKSAANEKIIQELILKQNTARINYDRALSDYKEMKTSCHLYILKQGKQRKGMMNLSRH